MATIPGVELARVGTWDLSTGLTTFTRADFEAAMRASADPAIGDPRLKLGHVDPRFDGSPSMGRVANMRLAGDVLFGDLVGVPQWLAVSMADAWPDRSIEGWQDVTTPSGEYALVIDGLALLGVVDPGVEGLAALPAYVAGSTRRKHVCASLGEMNILRRRAKVEATSASAVAEAFTDTAAATAGAQLVDVDTDGTMMVLDTDGDTYRVPWTADKAGAVTFGEPTKVMVTYTDAPAGDDSHTLDAGDLTVTEDPAEDDVETPPAKPMAAKGGKVDLTALAKACGSKATDEAALLAEVARLRESSKVAASVPAGATIVDASAFEALKVAAAAGVEALERAKATERGAFIGKALAAGKLAPASKKLAASLGDLYDDDPANAEAVLAEMPQVLPVRPVGTAGTPNVDGGGSAEFDTEDERGLWSQLVALSPDLARGEAARVAASKGTSNG